MIDRWWTEGGEAGVVVAKTCKSCRLKLNRLVVASFVSFLFLRSTVSSFWSAENRFFLHWQRVDIIGVFGAIFLVAILLFAGWGLAGYLGRAGRWFREFVFVFVFLQYMRVNLAESLVQVGWDVGWVFRLLQVWHVILLLAFLVFRHRIVRVFRGCALVLSPILLIYAWTLIQAQTYEQVDRTKTEIRQWKNMTRSELTGTNINRRVVVVVFDEWSYDRMFNPDGSVMPDYPETTAAVRQGTWFTQAYSPGGKTFVSLPSILRGVVVESMVDQAGQLVVKQDEEDLAYQQLDTMLTDFSDDGYRTALIGNYLPYADVMGRDADICISYDLYRVAGRSPLALSTSLVLENMRIRLSFLHDAFAWPYRYFKHRYFATIAQDIHTKTLDLIHCPEYELVFIHHSIPHMPFIFERNGAKSSLHHAATLSLDDYKGNLRYTDTLIGELYDAIRNRPENEEMLFILTSDHAFRKDPRLDGLSRPQRNRRIRHVPLIILQTERDVPVMIDVRFELVDLRGVIQEWMQTGELDFGDIIASERLGGE